MKKDVIITIKSTVTANDSTETMEMLVNGKVFFKDDCVYIGYKETSKNSIGNNNVLIKLKGNSCITITRSGDTPSQLIIEAQKRNLCSYSTEYGNVVMGIYASLIKTDIKSDGTGDIQAEYSLDVNTALLSENQLFINISENQLFINIKECAN